MKKTKRRRFRDSEDRDPVDAWTKAELRESCKRQREVLIANGERADSAEKKLEEVLQMEETRDATRHQVRAVLQNQKLPKEIRDLAANWLIAE